MVDKTDYSDWTPKELIKEIKNLKQPKKFGITWEYKDEDVVELCKKKLPILKEVKEKQIATKKDSTNNILIEGDNFHALSVLNYTHPKKIDMIYIDPPFNTGKKGSANLWKYNNYYVDSEDDYIHSKWLSMMKHRLTIAKKLVKRDGVLCCAIDDFELFSLLGLFEKLKAKVLGITVFVIKPEGRSQAEYFMTAHEYVIFVTWGNPKLNLMERDVKQDFPETESDGRKFRWDGFHRRGKDENRKENSNRWYPIYVSKNDEISVKKQKGWTAVFPIDDKGVEKIWHWRKDKPIEKIDYMTLDEGLKKKRDFFKVVRKEKKGKEVIKIYYKIYMLAKRQPVSYFADEKYNGQKGRKLVEDILGGESDFPFPKSVHSVIDCIDLFLPKDGIVLDFFAGSGTTGHATLMLNDRDGGSRQFILSTNNECSKEELKKLEKDNATEEEIQNAGICRKICYPRIKNVINGWFKDKNPPPEKKQIKSNLKYFKIDFVDTEHTDPTDKQMKNLVEQCTEMLCLKENCFDEIEKTRTYSIFKNHEKYLGIVYDDDGIEPLKKQIKAVGKEFSVYVFSLDDSKHEEEFEDVIDLVELNPIPSSIVSVYSKIWRRL